VIHGFWEKSQMNRDRFRPMVAQNERVEPQLPTDSRRNARVNDRRAWPAAGSVDAQLS
jgi:hypothetical protein